MPIVTSSEVIKEQEVRIVFYCRKRRQMLCASCCIALTELPFSKIFLYFRTCQERINEEIRQLVQDIQRIGETGSPQVKFGELFDDDQVANYYEALVGTLKSAKKRGVIDYKGQMLLKGMSDDVVISIKDSTKVGTP